MERFDGCDPEMKVIYQGTAYERVSFTCPNTHTAYAMTWLPTFCPCCGGRLGPGASRRYADAWKDRK